MVKVWDLASGKPVADFDHGYHLDNSATLSPDGKTLAVGQRGKVAIFDLPSQTREGGTNIWTWAFALGLAFSPDGKLLAVSDEHGHVNVRTIFATTNMSPT